VNGLDSCKGIRLTIIIVIIIIMMMMMMMMMITAIIIIIIIIIIIQILCSPKFLKNHGISHLIILGIVDFKTILPLE